MKPTARVTTNLNQTLFKFLSDEAKSSGTTFRAVLEKVIERYQTEKLKQETIAGYNAMSDDKDEMGMWQDIANSPENLKLPDDF